ncbi:unnamed protein product, partial [Ectocarpus sp. 12 AP-2014]
ARRDVSVRSACASSTEPWVFHSSEALHEFDRRVSTGPRAAC